ncbi:unnamed protein product [Brassica oleracea var. botrytis]
MNLAQVNFRVTQSRPLSPSEGYENSLTITIDTKSYDFLENPTTGHRIFTGRSTPVYPPALINISLLSSSPHDIFRQLLREQAIQDTNRPHVLAYLAKQISAAAISLGFGRNGFVMEIDYKVVYVVFRSDHPPIVEGFLVESRPLSPSEGYENSVAITIDIKSYDVLENPTNGHRIYTVLTGPLRRTDLNGCNLIRCRTTVLSWKSTTKLFTSWLGLIILLRRVVIVEGFLVERGNQGFEDGNRAVFYLSRQSRRLQSFELETWCTYTHDLFPCLPRWLSLGVASTQKHLPFVSDCANMIRPREELSDFKHERRSGSYVNSIIIVVDTISDEIQVSPSVRVDISLPSFLGRHHIRRLVQDQLINRRWLSPKISRTATKLGFSRREVLQDQFASHRWLSDKLAPGISEIAARLGFGCNGLIVTITVKITPSPSKEEVLTRMVQLGKISKEELKSSKMETEPCSICLDNLVSGKHVVSTRMTCSHVFHEKCRLVWFQRKNTCPLCRTVLYDRLMIGNKGSRN